MLKYFAVMKNKEVTCGVYFVDKNNQLLICKATFGGWSIPKGLIDQTDNGHFSTAVRELKEETNVDFYTHFDYVQFIKSLPSSKYKNKNKILFPFLVKVNLDKETFNLKCTSYFSKNGVQLPEIDQFKWVTINEAKDYLHESQINNLDMIKIHLKFTE